MANCSEDQCENLVTKLRNISRTEITSILDHFDKRPDANFKYFKNFEFFKTWLNDEYTSYSQDCSIHEAIESYLRIKEIQDKLSEFECSLIKKMNCTEQFPCPECGDQIKLNSEGSLWNTLQAHRFECAKHGNLIADEDCGNGELILKNEASSSSSAGTSTSVSVHGASTSQSEKDFDESSVNATQITKKTDEMLQSLILPEDHLSTWCVQCAEKVPYGEVNQHLSQKCHQLPSQLGGGASKKIVNYDDSVLKALYNGELYNYTLLIEGVEFFVIQNLGAFKHCIVCVENITEITNHVNSKAHKKLTNNGNVQKLLKLYHDTWVCQPLHIQIQQKYFRKHQSGMICVMCSVTVVYTNQALRLHLESSQHRLYVLKNTTVNDAEFEFSATNSEIETKSIHKAISDCIVDIINKSEHDLYPPLIMDYVYARDQSKLYTVQLKSNRSLRCLLCQVTFSTAEIPQLLHHVKTKKHKNKASNTSGNSWVALNGYHNYWNENEIYNSMQEDFWPVTDVITWCIKCGINLEYKHVYTHIKKYHVENAKDIDLSELLHEDFKCTPSIYETNILKKIYPDNIAQFNIIKNTISYPLIQTLKNVKKCILCTCFFKVDAITHLTSQKHVKNANHVNISHSFKKYHDTWISKKYRSVQKEQVYFWPRKNRLDCIFCACTIRRRHVCSHIQTKEHKAYVATYASSSTYPTEYLAQDAFSSKGPNANAVNQNFLLARTATDIIKKHYTELKGPLPSDNRTRIVDSYDPLVESILYPKSLTKLAQALSGYNILTIRLQTNTHFYCLLCFQTETSPKFLLKSEVHDHLAGQKHLKKYTNELMQSTLEAYHNYWMQKPLENQMLQIDFIPVNITKCRCLKCERLLEYSQLKKHFKTKKHSGLASDQSRYLSLIASSADLENSNLWKSVSDNTAKVSSNSIANETSQISLHNNISETANAFELNEISNSDSMSNSDDYEDDDTVDESESDSVVSFRDTTESDPSELNGHHSDSGDLNQQQKKEDNFQLKLIMKYDKLVEDTLYPDLQMGCIEVDGIKYPVFRILESEGVVCTICKGNPRVQSVMNHLESKAKHTRRMNDANVLSRLKRFHLFWMSQEASAQLLQKYFKTTESDCKLKCYLCEMILFYENCIEHVTLFHRETSEKRDNEDFTFQVANEVSDSSSLSPATVSGFYDNISDKYKVPDFNFQFKFEMKYDKSVEDVLYPAELRKHFMLIDNIKYLIFRVKADGFECLICNNYYSSIFISVEDHLNSPIHNCESQMQFTLTRLVVFHDFWMNQEPNLQLQQMYFGILDRDLKCILCDSTVTYEEVTTHVELPQHKKAADLKKQETTQAPSFSKQDLNQSNSLKSSPKPTAKASPTNKTKQEHKTRKAVSNPNSSVLLERMPERYKTHLHFFKIDSEGSISCLCCSMPIKYEVINLKQHLKTKDHIDKSKTPLTKFKFLCEICMKIYSSEDSWEKHLKEKDHLGILNNLGKGRKGNMLEYECVTCSLVIFGDKLSLMRHQQWNKVSSKKKKELKLPEGVRRLFESNQHIEEVANQLVTEANLESQNQEREKNCCLALVSVLKEIYPQCRAYPFGSRVIGLGSKDSDLDIFVDVDSMYTGNKLQNAEEQAVIVMEVKKILRKSKPIFSHINPVPTARTPIIQVFHVPTGIDCDVSFRHGLSVENTAFIRLCIDLQPVIQGVLLVLKQWCKMCDLNNFSSYALTMMAIFYFQTQGYLLTVKELRAINSNASSIIDGWETIKYTASLSTMKSHLKLCSLSVKDLLHDFFEFFARYDYEKQVMCPLLGLSILKTCFNDNGVNLPPEMKSYVQKIMQPDAELFRNRSPMCIQDPFDLLHNLTKACERSFLTKWRIYCDLTAKHLSALH